MVIGAAHMALAYLISIKRPLRSVAAHYALSKART